MGKRKATPEVEGIVAYWSVRIPETDLGTDWDEATIRCWCCGRPRKLQKCHITPHAQGGPATPDNLVLLCSHCHEDAPDVPNADAMFAWIRTSRHEFYDIGTSLKALARACADLGADFEVAYVAASTPEGRAKVKERLAQCGTHGGRLSASTVAWALVG